MLIMSRCLNESIVINGNIEVKIIEVRRIGGAKEVRLGITAPKSISVHRKEVQEAINKENRLSAVGL